ncbi:MAG: uracil-DNA glycosylase family protein [Myxococcota bacterium]
MDPSIEEDPLHLLADLIDDIAAHLEWRAACGAQLLPVGGPDLPPLPAPEPEPDRRAPAPPGPPQARSPQRQPTQRPPQHAAPNPPRSLAPQAKKPSAPPQKRTLSSPWEKLVNAPKKTLTGPAGVRHLASRVGTSAVCQTCRNRLLVGDGEGASPIAIISGQTFVPEADMMLTRMLKHVLRVDRRQAFVIHLHHRCKSFYRPGPADPIRDCGALLREQLLALRPRLMLALGSEGSRALLSPRRIQVRRGVWVDYRVGDLSLPTFMTFHPNFLVQHPENKRHAFSDLKAFRERMDMVERNGAPT